MVYKKHKKHWYTMILHSHFLRNLCIGMFQLVTTDSNERGNSTCCSRDTTPTSTPPSSALASLKWLMK